MASKCVDFHRFCLRGGKTEEDGVFGSNFFVAKQTRAAASAAIELFKYWYICTNETP